MPDLTHAWPPDQLPTPDDPHIELFRSTKRGMFIATYTRDGIIGHSEPHFQRDHVIKSAWLDWRRTGAAMD